MSSQSGRFRSGRTPGSLRVAVTRAGSRLGTAVAGALTADGDEVIGLDSRSGAATDVHWRLTDLTSPHLVDALRDVDALVHLAHGVHLASELSEDPAVRRDRMMRELQTLTVSAAAAGVRHLVVVTSAMIYGARPDNEVPLPEDSPLRSGDTEGMVADLVDVEELLDRAREVHPGLRVTSVRPAALVGPGVDSIITRHFEAPRLLTLKGSAPRWQFCHVDDLGAAVRVVLHQELGPVVAVGAPGSLSQEQLEELSGMRHVAVAPSAAHGAADRLHRLGVLPLPASDLAYVSDPWVVDPRQLMRNGWRPAHDNAACVQVLLEDVRGHHALMARRVERKDAALGAAGAASAAVAVVATAALLRRRRRRP
ncbi:NAD-dependent epimerase/dehydratase family protein [Ornithinimicrobium cavernae]|uniref:NAD-dependent epimerase/dehydratase family protein n=1 Tax=Ornithinimicrobium cavernae TaxID=2666047 RepID=UPI000D694CBB|nr:NAD-dependent epimerase/dehydratase family protein [Ornithinimicrobium cavernae]